MAVNGEDLVARKRSDCERSGGLYLLKEDWKLRKAGEKPKGRSPRPSYIQECPTHMCIRKCC